jgi:hypothetical protein
MNLRVLIQKIWHQFLSLRGNPPSSTPSLLFKRVKETGDWQDGTGLGDWRSGAGLWCGTLPLFSNTRVYYLEVARVSYADKRELGIKPSPTHTFKVYYFTSSQSASQTQKQRVMVFVAYQNCHLQGSSEDFIAVEIIGQAIHRRLERLCKASSGTKTPDSIKAEVVARPGELPMIRITEGNNALPAVSLIGRATEQTREDWQRFVDQEMQKERDKRTERIRNKIP